MKRYLRTVTKKHKTKFEHSMNIPAEIVKKLELSESIVELKIIDNSIVMKKIGDTLEGISPADDVDDEYVTIHY